MTTLYDILGVPPSATDAEIKAAYRKAAMRWHPDRNLDNQAEADRKFKELAHAFSVLSDGDKRRAYDQARASEQPEESAAHEDDDAAARVFFKTMFELANELAQRGYNSDVLLGAMLSQGCPEGVARAIAEQVAAARKRSSGASTQNPRPRTSPPASAPPAASGAPATQARQSSLGTWAFGLFLAFSIVWAALKMSGGDAAQESQDAPAMPVAVAGAPQAFQAPQAQLAPLLPPNVVAFNEESQAGLIKYDRLPEDEAFNSLRGSIDKAFKFKLEQTLQAGKDKLLLFSSTPWSESDADAYSCHACSPLLSAMLVSDTAQGSVVKLPLQVLEPMGAWGRIELGGDSQPTIVNVAPGKLAAFVPSSDMAQGVSVSWARLFSLEKDGFKPLGGLKLLEDTMATSFCETDPSTCSRAESRVHFVKTARTNGYYDLAVTVRATKIGGGVKQQTETTSVLRFDGVQYAAPAVPKEQQAPTAVGAPAERVVESSEAH